MKKKKQKPEQKKEVKMMQTKFYFIKNDKTYTLTVTAPEDVPKYRLHEIFWRNFVVKERPLSFDPTLFYQYKGTYTVS